MGIGPLIGISFHISLFQLGNLTVNIDGGDSTLNSLDSSETDYNFGLNTFNSTGSQLNVSLYNWRNKTKSNSTEDGGISIKNPNNGNWNMSKFSLNFTDIYAKNKSVKFETRNDGSLQFSKKNKYYASSFRVPNTCNLTDISMFVQYPGAKGTGTMGLTGKSSFNITVYNSSSNITPDNPIHDSNDEINFNLTNKIVSQPARWYQSNFTDMVLNISDTHNNTFFVVFQSIEFPTFSNDVNAYMYYANEEPSDKYNISFYEKDGTEDWKNNNLKDKNGLFKAGFAPIQSRPSAKQINLTVFSKQLNLSTYEYTHLFPHQDNEFFIPISSLWFGNVHYNLTFEGCFQYNTLSNSEFSTTADQFTNWSLQLAIDIFPDDSYNRSAIFYKPNYWKYEKVLNGTEIYDKINPYSRYVELLNISNGDWEIRFNQSNNIIDPTYYSGETKSDWTQFDTEVNAYQYINITSHFNNSNGDAYLNVYNPELDLQFQERLENQSHTFPLWRPRYNTSIYNNETMFQVNIMTNNGTLAGIISKNFTVILNKTQPTLTLHGNLGDHVYGDSLDLWVKLSDNTKGLSGETIYFKLIINGGSTEITLNDTTDDEGIARISYSIGEVSSIKVHAYYDGSIDYSSSASTASTITVRSPLEQLFLDFLPFLVLIIIGVGAVSTYLVIKRYRFKKNMKEWKKKTDLFSDVLAIDLILVIHKEVSVALLKRNFTKEEIDGDMISGFLQAITSFKYEIKEKRKDTTKRESMLLDYRDYKILIEDGEYTRCALILNSDPSANLEKSQQEFIKKFEHNYRKELKEFTGQLKGFESAGELIDKYFNMSFIKPHIINENPPAISLSSFQERIIGVCKTIQADTEQFYISRVLEYLISAMPDEPKEKLIANIYDIKQYGFIKPI